MYQKSNVCTGTTLFAYNKTAKGTYDVISRYVRVSIVAVEKQQFITFVLAVGLQVYVNNTKPLSVAMEMQE
jgi:hypothetical protein